NLDVDLRGASAYSTLGWFRDPVLSTMIPEGEEATGDVVNVVLHESVHATYYVRGQAYLNESVANFVADRLTPAHMRASRGAESAELKAWERAEAESNARGALLHGAYDDLSKLYSSVLPDEQKLARKREILGALKPRFTREINNATLIQFQTYNVGVRE